MRALARPGRRCASAFARRLRSSCCCRLKTENGSSATMKGVHRGIELAALAAAGILIGCGGSGSQALAPRSSLIAEAPPAAAFRSPAIWRYHPSEAAALLARTELTDGRVLLAGELGERWLVDEKRG